MAPLKNGLLTAVGAPFVAIEKESAVFDDRTADSTTESVADERWPRNLLLTNPRLTELDLRIIRSVSAGAVVKEIVGSKHGRTV
jgi:hypothetical protein